MESVLIIVFPETRAYNLTFDFFKSNFLDSLQADLCLCVRENKREEKNNPFYKHAKYVLSYEEPSDWSELFDSAQEVKNYQGNWRQLLEIQEHWLGEIKEGNIQLFQNAILLFSRWFLKEQIISNNILEKYDRYIITRSDFIHEIPHIPMEFLDSKFIWLPDGEDYGGLTDRHIVVHRNDIINVLSIADPIITNPDQLYQQMSNRQDWNLEKYVKFAFNNLGLLSRVKRFPYTMYTVRQEDTPTTWSQGTFNERLGYRIKYDREYRSSFWASKVIRQVQDWNTQNISLINTLIGIDRSIIDRTIYVALAESPDKSPLTLPEKIIFSIWNKIVWRAYWRRSLIPSLIITLFIGVIKYFHGFTQKIRDTKLNL
jgi:hypothetical protein